jgi:hypothetical protein
MFKQLFMFVLTIDQRGNYSSDSAVRSNAKVTDLSKVALRVSSVKQGVVFNGLTTMR